MRRPEALDAAALLVDQDRRLTSDRTTKLIDQPAQGFRLADVALKDDETPRIGLFAESPLVCRQRSAGKSGDESTHSGRLACA
jgi:hypothetical protein